VDLAAEVSLEVALAVAGKLILFHVSDFKLLMKISFYLFLFFSFCTSYSQEYFESEKVQNNKVIEDLNASIATDPSAENYYYRGYYNYLNDDLVDAISDYDKAVSLNPNDFNIYFSRGNLLLKLKDYQNAINDFSTCIAIDGNSQKAYFNRAFAKRKFFDRTGAIEDYSKSIALKPDNLAAYQNRGLLRKELNLHKDAIADFNEVIKIDPKSVDAFQNRAVSKAMIHAKDALADFDTAVNLAPENAETYFNRALYFINFKIKGNYCADLKKAFNFGYLPAQELIIEYCKI